MWEHAAAVTGLLAVPAALKNGIDVADRIIKGRLNAKDGGEATKAQLGIIRTSFETLIIDATELAAYKRLHTITNQVIIDLRFTLMTDNVDEEWAAKFHLQHRNEILNELRLIWEGERAGGQLNGLRGRPDFMKHLRSMPPEINHKIQEIEDMQHLDDTTWDTCLWNLIHKAEKNIKNFSSFYECAGHLRGINAALNNYANRSMERGIDTLENLLTQLRNALA